jgi:hypothetical protein
MENYYCAIAELNLIAENLEPYIEQGLIAIDNNH